MKASGRSPIVISTVLLAACWLTVISAAVGADPPAERFLEALRKNNYYDVALDYLQEMSQRADCPPELKEKIDYEIGVTLLEAADAIEMVSERETKLDEATAAIQKFLNEHPAHELAAPATTRIGMVLLLRGAVRSQQAELPGLSSEDKETKQAEAREFFDRARVALESAENLRYAEAKKLKELADAEGSDAARERSEIANGAYLQARLLLVNTADQKARTYPADSKEFKEQLAAAAQRYNELFEKYEGFPGGLQARNFEAKVYRDLDENQKAVDIFLEMLSLPDGSPAIRNLKLQSVVWLMETYLKPDVKKYDQALETAATWKESAMVNEEKSSEGLRIQLLAGQAAIETAKTLEPKDNRRRDLLRSARRYLEFVQRAPGAIRKEAGDLLTDELFGAAEVSDADPKTFEEAFEQANVAWLRMLTTDGQMRQATDAAKKAELSQSLTTARENALDYCHLALELADKSTDMAQVNQVRSFLTFLYFFDQRLYDAAVMGELLAYRYPESGGARRGAEIAIKAYRSLFDTERRADRDTSFELAQMQRVAQYVTARWNGDAVAEEAWVMLLDTAVDLQDIEKATEYLDKLAPDSPQRAKSELRLGQVYWSQYLRQASLEDGERPSQEELDGLVKKAQDTLRQGIDRMSQSVETGGEVTYPLVFSVKALAQILIDAGDAREAVRWLDDPKVGPMTLVGADSPVVAGKTDFQIDTYKAALRAYVGAEELGKAEAVMEKLEELVGQEDADGAKRLTQIYISLGRQLEDLLTRLRNEGKADEIQKVSEGFEKFLETISQREQGNSFSSLNWVAQTFFSLGAGLDPGTGPLPAEALKYFDSAGKTYLRILKSPPADMPEGADTTIKVQMAVCLRAMGRRQDSPDPQANAKKIFTQALGLLVGILKERETRVDVQMEAARTYQDLAGATEQPKYYLNAILGGQKQADGHYLIWGWNGISRRVASREEYRAIFFESRYNIAVCRMRYAQSQTGAERQKTLELAENDVVLTYKLYPSLGGPEWFEKFEALLKKIRTFRGLDNPKGLKDDA